MTSSKLHPWPVLRGILLDLSSYQVPKIIDRVGLSVNWKLSEKENYSDKTRIAAYRPRIDTAYNDLCEEDRVRIAYIVADELSKCDLGEELDIALRTIGWQIESGKLAPNSQSVRELFFPKQSQHDAYVQIRTIFQRSTTSIFVVDPFINQMILTLFASSLQQNMTFRLLTAKVPADFGHEAKTWSSQYQDAILEVRTTREFHDRFVVIDDSTCWHIGASIKDAGNKAFMLSAIEDEKNCRALLAQMEESWQSGTPCTL